MICWCFCRICSALCSFSNSILFAFSSHLCLYFYNRTSFHCFGYTFLLCVNQKLRILSTAPGTFPIADETAGLDSSYIYPASPSHSSFFIPVSSSSVFLSARPPFAAIKPSHNSFLAFRTLPLRNSYAPSVGLTRYSSFSPLCDRPEAFSVLHGTFGLYSLCPLCSLFYPRCSRSGTGRNGSYSSSLSYPLKFLKNFS